MSAFCGKYPDCGCIGIGKRCYSDKTFADEGILDTCGLESPSVNINYIIPRNRPCPCGSGKKYKHCCAHNMTVHVDYPLIIPPGITFITNITNDEV